MHFALVSMLALSCAEASFAFAPAPVDASVAPAAIAAPVRLAVADQPETLPPPPAGAAPDEVAPVAFSGLSDEAVVERAFGALEALTTLEGEFTQVAPSGAVSSGRFFLRRPGLLRFEYDPPTPLLVVANGGMVFVRDEALETTDSYPVNQTPLKFLLNRKVDLGDAKLIDIERGPSAVSLTFASADEETEGEITLDFSAPDLALQQWAISDPQGGMTVVALENVIAGRDIANRLFRVPETDSPFLKN